MVSQEKWEVFSWCKLRKITAEQLAPSNEVEQQKRAVFDADIRQILGESFSLLVEGMHIETRYAIEEKSEIFMILRHF